jgi:hypothetical protein
VAQEEAMKDWSKIPIEEVKSGNVVEWQGQTVQINYPPMIVDGQVHLAIRGEANISAPVGTEIEVYR